MLIKEHNILGIHYLRLIGTWPLCLEGEIESRLRCKNMIISRQLLWKTNANCSLIMSPNILISSMLLTLIGLIFRCTETLHQQLHSLTSYSHTTSLS